MKRRMAIAFTTVCFLMATITENGPAAAGDKARKVKAFAAALMQYKATHTLEEFYEYAEAESKKLKMKFFRPDSDEGKRLIESVEAKLKKLKRNLDTVVQPVSYRPAQLCLEATRGCTSITSGGCIFICQFFCCDHDCTNSYSVTTAGCESSYLEFPAIEGNDCGCSVEWY